MMSARGFVRICIERWVELGWERTIDSSHDKADLGCIGCTCKVGVDLLGLVLVQRNKPIQNVIASRSIIRSTFSNIRSLVFHSVGSILVELAFIVWEIILHRGNRKLFLEPVDLVQEQDDRGFDEPARVAN